MSKTEKKGTFGERLIESVREAVQIERGEVKAARITRYTAAEAKVVPPPRYVAERIREIRDQMALSQPVFAAALNVSAETVRAWEQGKREPDGPTLRLLEVAEQHPEVLLAKGPGPTAEEAGGSAGGVIENTRWPPSLTTFGPEKTGGSVRSLDADLRGWSKSESGSERARRFRPPRTLSETRLQQCDQEMDGLRRVTVSGDGS